MARPICPGDVLLPQKSITRMGGRHRRRNDIEIASDPEDQNAVPDLSRAKIGGIHELPNNLVILPTLGRRQPRAVLGMRLLWSADHSWPLKMRDDPLKIGAEA